MKNETIGEWIEFDPDYRIEPPKHTALYCCRCQKSQGNLIPVELHPDGMHVRRATANGLNGNAFLGTTCYKKVFSQTDKQDEN